MVQTKTSSRSARLGALATAIGLLAVITPAGAASAAPPTTRTVGLAAVNTQAQSVVAKDDRTAGQGVLDVAQFNTTRARLDNRATAVTRNCRDCRAVALAFQVVLLNGPSFDVRATNRSEAQNFDCVRCETLSVAYQFVLASNHGVQLDQGDLDELAQLERELEALAALPAEVAPLGALAAAVDQRALQVAAILQRAYDRTDPAASPSPDEVGLRGRTGISLPAAASAVAVERHAETTRR